MERTGVLTSPTTRTGNGEEVDIIVDVTVFVVVTGVGEDVGDTVSAEVAT